MSKGVELKMPGGNTMVVERVFEMRSWIWNQLTADQKAMVQVCGCGAIWFVSKICWHCQRCPECSKQTVSTFAKPPCDGCGRFT